MAEAQKFVPETPAIRRRKLASFGVDGDDERRRYFNPRMFLGKLVHRLFDDVKCRQEFGQLRQVGDGLDDVRGGQEDDRFVRAQIGKSLDARNAGDTTTDDDKRRLNHGGTHFC